MDDIKLLQKLIQIPSLSGQEEILATFIVNYLKSNDIVAKIQNGNVIVHLKGKNKNKALIFNAHMDTVSVGNKAKWKYPPTGKNAGKLDHNKIYGLGASDDKAAIAAMLILAQSMSNPPCDVWFTFVVREETDGFGSSNFLSWFVKSRWFTQYKKVIAIIGEPTDLNSIEIGHRGNVFIELTTNGISGHGAKSYSSTDLAVVKMINILGQLQKTFKKWKKKYKDSVLGEPSMNITSFHTAGESMNKIPHQCIATLDIRTTPKLHDKIEKLLVKTVGSKIFTSRIKGKTAPGITSFHSHIVKICSTVIPNIKIAVSTGSTDLSQFISHGIDTVIFGPGDKNVIHKENEYAEVYNIGKAVDYYKKIIYEYAF